MAGEDLKSGSDFFMSGFGGLAVGFVGTFLLSKPTHCVPRPIDVGGHSLNLQHCTNLLGMELVDFSNSDAAGVATLIGLVLGGLAMAVQFFASAKPSQ